MLCGVVAVSLLLLDRNLAVFVRFGVRYWCREQSRKTATLVCEAGLLRT